MLFCLIDRCFVFLVDRRAFTRFASQEERAKEERARHAKDPILGRMLEEMPLFIMVSVDDLTQKWEVDVSAWLASCSREKKEAFGFEHKWIGEKESGGIEVRHVCAFLLENELTIRPRGRAPIPLPPLFPLQSRKVRRGGREFHAFLLESG